MTWFQAIVLGAVQGLTELLPVSSSAHLALVPKLAGWDDPPLAFTVAVHLGTLAAVCIYFRYDLLGVLLGLFRTLVRRGSTQPGEGDRGNARLAGLLLIATVPAAVAGVLLEDQVEQSFGSVPAVGALLIVTALILWGSERLSRRASGRERVTLADAVLIGLGQACALFPGISRSGATIGTGMAVGVKPEEAVRFGFLLSIPVILGGGAVEGLRAVQANLPVADLARYGLGAAVAGITAWAAIVLVFRAVRRGRLAWFGVYCAVVGLAALVVGLAGYLPA